MTEAEIYLKFDSYEFRRVKQHSSTNGVIYADKKWIGKDALIIPVPYDISDKMIERCKNKDGIYEICIPINAFFTKQMKDANSVSRVYLPFDFIGADCIIVEAPKIEYF